MVSFEVGDDPDLGSGLDSDGSVTRNALRYMSGLSSDSPSVMRYINGSIDLRYALL